MTSHELAKKLLELPEDTPILYLEKGEVIFTKVNTMAICQSSPSEKNFMYEKIQELISEKKLVANYVILNPSND